LDCTVGESGALVRHQLRIGPEVPGWAGPAVVGTNRAVAVRLVAGPDVRPPLRRHGDGWAWMALDGPGWLLTAVAGDLPSLLERVAAAGPLPSDGGMVRDADQSERSSGGPSHPTAFSTTDRP
jgi:hypothetical protein